MVRHRSSSKSNVGLSKESINPLMASELMEGQWSFPFMPSNMHVEIRLVILIIVLNACFEYVYT